MKKRIIKIKQKYSRKRMQYKFHMQCTQKKMKKYTERKHFIYQRNSMCISFTEIRIIFSQRIFKKIFFGYAPCLSQLLQPAYFWSYLNHPQSHFIQFVDFFPLSIMCVCILLEAFLVFIKKKISRFQNVFI